MGRRRHNTVRPHRWVRLSWVVLVVGVMLSCSVSWGWYRSVEQQNRRSFDSAADGVADSITSALNRNADSAESVAALASSMPGLTNRTFQDWYTAIGDGRPAGIPAIGFIRYVPAPQLPAYLASHQGDIAPDGTAVTSNAVIPPGDRSSYCLAELGVWRITELSLPSGLDYCAVRPSLLVDAQNRATTVSPAVSKKSLEAFSRMLGAPITALPASLKGTYFYSTPVFARDVGANNDELHPGLLGWVGGFLNPGDLLSASVPKHARLNIGLAHVNTPGNVTTVVRMTERWRSEFHRRATVEVDGAWVIDISGAGTRGGYSPLAQAVMVGAVAILVNLLLFVLFRVLASAESSAVVLVERRTRELRAANEDRAQLLKGTLEVGEREQSRLAAELHDGPIQMLTASCFVVDRALRRLKRNDYDAATALLEQVRTELSDDTAALRTMMVELRPPLLDEAGLAAGLHSYADAFAARTGLDVEFVDGLGDTEIPPALEVALYRIGQQSLVNVDRHAAASRVVVGLHLVGDGEIELSVSDNGRGFDPSTAPTLLREGHYGLAGMRERIEVAGGEWTLTSAPAAGTTISARAPIEIDAPTPQLTGVG